MIAESSIFGILLALIFWICIWSILAWRGLRFIRKGELFPDQKSPEKTPMESPRDSVGTSALLKQPNDPQEDTSLKIASPREKGDGCMEGSGDEDDWPQVTRAVTLALVHRESSDRAQRGSPPLCTRAKNPGPPGHDEETTSSGDEDLKSRVQVLKKMDSEHKNVDIRRARLQRFPRRSECQHEIDLDAILECDIRECSDCFSSESELV